MKITTTKRTIQHINCVVYGESGVGKTVLGSTAPKPIILSAEQGLLSLADKDIAVVEITSFKVLEDACATLLKDTEYKTIVLDSLSEVGETLLTEFKPQEKDPRQAYLKMADELFRLSRQFRNMPKHVVLIAKEELHKDEMTGRVRYRPSTPGQFFTSNLPYLFDIVLAMRVKTEGGNITRFLQTQPDGQYYAKDRSGKLGKVEAPNLSSLFSKILEA